MNLEEGVQVKSTADLLREIGKLEQPDVFTAGVSFKAHMWGFLASASLRGGHEPRLEEITAWGDTPEDALLKLLAELKEKFGPCPHCGR